MKKRVLSMLLALTLCFTAFTAFAAHEIGAPAGGKLETNVDRLDNVLKNATAEQQKAVETAVGDVPEVDITAEPWATIAGILLNDQVLEKGEFAEGKDALDMTTRPYFFMRWLEDRYMDIPDPDGEITKDIHDYPRICELVEAFQNTNNSDEYDISKGSIKDGLGKFDGYSEVISEELNSFIEDVDGQIELLAYTGIISGLVEGVEIVDDEGQPLTPEQLYETMMEMNFSSLEEAINYLNERIPDVDVDSATYTVDDAKYELLLLGEKQASVELELILQKLVDFVTNEASDENYEFGQSEGNILYDYREIMRDDETLKNSAIIVGKDLLNLLTDGLMGAIRDFVKGQDITNPDSEVGSLLVDFKNTVFNKDTNTAIDGAHNFIHTLAKIVERESASNAKLAELVKDLDARGLTIDDVIEIEEAFKGEVDKTNVLEVIWLNLGLSRVLKAEASQPIADSNNEDIYYQNIDLTMSHRFISRYVKNPDTMEKINNWVPGWFYIAIDDENAVTDPNGLLGITTTLEKDGYTITLVQDGTGMHQLEYDATKVPEGTVLPVIIYRGAEALDDSVPEVERYVMKTEVILKGSEVVPPTPTEKTITIKTPESDDHTAIKDVDKHVSGDEIKISGSSTEFELISIYIEAPGAKRFLYSVVTPAEFAFGVTYKLPTPAVPGVYTVIAGDNAKNDTAYFEVVDDSSKIYVVQEDPKQFDSKTGSFPKVSGSRNATWASLLSKKKNPVPSVVKLVTAEGELAGTAAITWLYEEADLSAEDKNAGYVAYDPKNTKNDQKIKGIYSTAAKDIEFADENAVYEVIVNDDDYEYPIDGEVSVLVKLSSGGPTSTSTSSYADFTDAEMSFNGNTNVLHVVGTTNINKVLVEVVGPDGKVLKSVELTLTQLKNGYDIDLSDLAPLGIGEYTVNLKSTDGKTTYDQYKFRVEPVTFMVTEHVNYVQGYPDGTVRPDANITRDEVAAMLFRLLNDNYRNGWMTKSTDKFSDLTDDIWSMTPIATMTTAGIINGYPNGTFGTGKQITRAEFAAMVARMCAVKPEVGANPYSDIDDTWAKDEILIATTMGWFQGNNGQFRPNDKLTRAEAITVINRMLGRDTVTADSFKSMTVKEFSDLSADAWYYTAIVEATNAHEHEMSKGVEIWTKTEETEDWTTYEK